MSKIKVVYKEVGKEPTVIEIENTLEAKQELVDGYIEEVPFGEGLCLICNEEGKLDDLEPNIRFLDDYIAGNCFVVGDDFENAAYCSVPDEKIESIIEDLNQRTIL